MSLGIDALISKRLKRFEFGVPYGGHLWAFGFYIPAPFARRGFSGADDPTA